MASLKLRDRDAIITKEGLIFRVFGYSHPPDAFLCDAEYASARIFKSKDPRAPRTGGNQRFFKFYNDEGLKLVFNQFPKYTFFHKMLRQKVVGINQADIEEVRKPKERLFSLFKTGPKDELEDAAHRVVSIVLESSDLVLDNLGVFGSMLHDFHHPKFSDIDLVVYGRKENTLIREKLQELYSESTSSFRNEFENNEAIRGKKWRFKNYKAEEFLWHQKRKKIYGLFEDKKSRRTIKAEFEPVKDWSEISSEYNAKTQVLRKGWTKIEARVVDATDSAFIPSIYQIEPLALLKGRKEAFNSQRVVSYMEEFRLQAEKDEEIRVEGNLEEVISPKGNFHQITLTYCPRYYEQVLKVLS